MDADLTKMYSDHFNRDQKRDHLETVPDYLGTPAKQLEQGDDAIDVKHEVIEPLSRETIIERLQAMTADTWENDRDNLMEALSVSE